MKNSILFFALLVIPLSGFSQRKSDLGLIAGTDFYLGDINPVGVFMSPRYAFGPVFRYNFNERYSVRFQGVYTQLAGSENPDRFISKRLSPVSFNVNFVNLAAQVEYNFFDYKTGDKPGIWTPFIFGGVGYSLMLATNLNNTSIRPVNSFTMPFGVGAKINLTRRLSAGGEWSLNKTFSDRLDGVISPLENGEILFYGNDWYSFFGLFITYKFFKFADDCPVYD